MKNTTPTAWRPPTPAEREFIYREWKFDLHVYFHRSIRTWKFLFGVMSCGMLAVVVDMLRIFLKTASFGYYSTDQGVLLSFIACALMLLLIFLYQYQNLKYRRILESLRSGTFLVLDTQAEIVRLSRKRARLIVNSKKVRLPFSEAQRLLMQNTFFPRPCLVITVGKIWRNKYLSCVPELDYYYG